MADDRTGKDKIVAKKHFNILDNIRTVVLAWPPTCDELMRITLRQEEASHALKPKYSQLHKTGYWENVQENSIICNQYNHNFAPLQWSFQPEMMANSVTVLVCHDNYKYWIQISYFFIISINTWNMCLLLSSSLCPRFLFLSFDLCDSDDGNYEASKDPILRPRSNYLYLHDCVDCCSGKVIS